MCGKVVEKSFIVITSSKLNELIEEVDRKIQEGYVPSGGVQNISGYGVCKLRSEGDFYGTQLSQTLWKPPSK